MTALLPPEDKVARTGSMDFRVIGISATVFER